MPWREWSLMSEREEVVVKALLVGANKSEIAKRAGISRKTLYKWCRRYQEGGREALLDQSRRPIHSPTRIPEEVVKRVLRVRDAHEEWGPKKIHKVLEREGQDVPSASGITLILRREGRIARGESGKHKAFGHFEAEEPNKLWQMDHKGYFYLGDGHPCYPLTILDDHSRFLIGLFASGNERKGTVIGALERAFRIYGLPQRIVFDNGRPWGHAQEHPYTEFGVWLLRLGIKIAHSRPRHPQTLGKDERLHRTLKGELLSKRSFSDREEAQTEFDRWRYAYNYYRPHEALGLEVPASRYSPSVVAYPNRLPEIDYSSDFIVRRVGDKGEVSFRGNDYRVGKAFRGYPVGLKPASADGVFYVYFLEQSVGIINLRH